MHPLFDAATRNALRRVLNEATEALPEQQRTQDRKAALAFRILQMAAEGERDSETLRRRAVADTEYVEMWAQHPEATRPPARRCVDCGETMRLVFRAPHPSGAANGEILEYHCASCGTRMTAQWRRSPGA